MSGAITVQHGAFGRAALYQLDKPIITHVHREAHLIFYIGGAGATVHVGDSQVQISATKAAAVSPWVPHSFEIDKGDEACTCLVVYIKPMWFLEHSKSVDHALSFGDFEIEVTKPIISWMNRLSSHLLEEAGSEMFDSILYEITRRCYEHSWAGKNPLNNLKKADNKFFDFRVRRAIRLMKENFTDDVDLDWLARQSGLSRPHFFKLFKRQMGITPNLYLSTLRAEQAIDELMKTEKSITDIGFDLGFSSQASFTRFFTSNVGIPPSDYRRVAHLT